MENVKQNMRVGWFPLLLVGVGVVCGVLALLVFSGQVSDRTRTQAHVAQVARYESTVVALDAKARSAKTEAEWSAVAKSAGELPEEFQETRAHFVELSTVRIIEAKAKRRDELLYNAGLLLRINEKDPLATKYLADAKVIHQEIERMLKTFKPRGNDPVALRAFYYRQCYETYRSQAFIEKDAHAEATDIIANAVGLCAKVFETHTKDIRSEEAIEFMYPQAKDSANKSGSRGSQGTGRVRALPGTAPSGEGAGTPDRPRLH